MKRGIYAGSFDPTTRGHLDVIRRASLIVDELHVMIGVNPKKSGGFFSARKAPEADRRIIGAHGVVRSGQKRVPCRGIHGPAGRLLQTARHPVQHSRAAGGAGFQLRIRDARHQLRHRPGHQHRLPGGTRRSSSSSAAAPSRSLPAIGPLLWRKYVTPCVASALLDANYSLLGCLQHHAFDVGRFSVGISLAIRPMFGGKSCFEPLVRLQLPLDERANSL